MIDIQIDGKSLSIPSDITLTLEQSAPWADLDNLCADIVWTFDLPAATNALILDHAASTLVSHHRRYDCRVLYASCPIADGQLYVQTSQDEKTLSCGITFNPIAIGWGSQKLADSLAAQDFEIANSALTFKQQWKQFLLDSTDLDSDIKFFLLADDKVSFDAHGYFRNKKSPIQQTTTPDNIFISWLNRLFLNDSGAIIDKNYSLPTEGDAIDIQGLRIFNDDYHASSDAKFNGYFFLPAIRLTFILQSLFAKVGRRVTGNFISNPYIRNLFSQSLCALDGDIYQYTLRNNLSIANTTSAEYEEGSDANSFIAGLATDNVFTITKDSAAIPTITSSFYLTTGDLQLNQSASDQGYPTDVFACYDEVFGFLIKAEDSDFSDGLWRYHDPGTGIYVSCYGSLITASSHYICNLTRRHDCDFVQITDSKGITIEDSSRGIGAAISRTYASGQLTRFTQSGLKLRIYLVKAKVYTANINFIYCQQDSSDTSTSYPTLTAHTSDQYSRINLIKDFEYINSSIEDYIDQPTNVFNRYFRYSQHMPNLTNAQFISALSNFFGLTPWYSPDGGDFQISFFKDIFSAKSIVIDEYVSAVKKTNSDPQQYTFTPDYAHTSADLSDDQKISPVARLTDLPKAANNKGKHCLVLTENVYYKSTRDDGKKTYSWVKSYANDDTLVCGSSDTVTEHTADIKIPNMRTVDTAYTHKYICEEPTDIISPLLSDGFSGEFDFHLNQYRGHRLLTLSNSQYAILTEEVEATIEYANPTNYNADGTQDPDYINLTATGDNSVGEMWLKPYLTFLANKEDFEFTAHLPVHVFFAMLRLMRPQDGSESEQTRWISYRQQRYLPSKISYSITSSEFVTATITAHRESTPTD